MGHLSAKSLINHLPKASSHPFGKIGAIYYTPILKSGKPDDVTNYQPILGQSYLGKIFELVVLKWIERFFLSTISIDRHEFFSSFRQIILVLVRILLRD